MTMPKKSSDQGAESSLPAFANDPSSAAGPSAASAAAAAADSNTRKYTSPVFLILRILLFVLACVFAVMGVMGFIGTSETQSESRLATISSIQGQPTHRSCVILSYDESDSSTVLQRDGATSVLGLSGVAPDVFYLDSRASAPDEAAEALTSRILAKAAGGLGYDVVVAAGDDALQYVMDNQALFAGVPVSFFAVSDGELAVRAHDQGIGSGIVESGTPSLILKEAANLVPAASRVVVLVDGSTESTALLAQLEGVSVSDLAGVRSQADASLAAPAPSFAAPALALDVWDTSTTTRDELAANLSALDAGTIVLLLGANRDAQGNAYTPTATAYFLAQSTAAPVFSAQGGVGEGICGASFIDREAEGSDAAKLAIDLMNGASAQARPLVTTEPSCSVFDAQALESHGINPDSTPEDATIVNESSFSWRVLRPYVRPLLFLLVAVACIVGFGVIGFRRSVRSNQAIVASRNDLQYRLYHDLLTELPNRHALEDFVADPATGEKVKAVMQIDINAFTDINDSYGHAFGDEVIKIVAKRLGGMRSLLLVRSGGDEFTMAFDRQLGADSPELRHLSRIFSDPITVGDSTLDVSARAGIANRQDGMTAQDLVVFADLAAYEAKERNVRQPVFYNAAMRDSMERKLQITAYLKRAIAEENVSVLWQPQVATETLEVYGYEALCRLHGNAYYPSDFIPVAEMSGLVNPLDRIVTKKVVEQLGAWRREDRQVGVASINFSAAQLRDKGYCDFLAEQLAANDVPASLLKIEITESMLIGNEEEATKLFARLRSMGITLALDDFGTGYSSLHRMAKRPFDFVKLDKSLVDTFMVPGQEDFIGDITQLIHGLGKKIVVEGVETLEQYEMCVGFGCDYIQGFFFARPLPADEAIDFDPRRQLETNDPDQTGKARNREWQNYARDERGRWTKKPQP